ncbi:MAG: PEP-CTERM sorting domain-containing protein, partial [Pyrinomonadaceae bacterium]
KRPLSSASASLRAEQPRADLFALRGALTDAELLEPGAALVRASRDAQVAGAWSPDTFKLIKAETHSLPTDQTTQTAVSDESRPVERVVKQTIRERRVRPASRLVLVLDTSAQMRNTLAQVAAAVRALPPETELDVLLADENAVEAEGTGQRRLTGPPQMIADEIARIECSGGADNVPALARAWDIAAVERQGAPLVWVHGAQPVLLHPAGPLLQRFARRPDGAPLYTLLLTGGANRIEEELDGAPGVFAVPRFGGVREGLDNLFGELTGRRAPLEIIRTNVPRASLSVEAAQVVEIKETSAHLVRLWAKEEVERLGNDSGKRDEAVRLAASYQLVTPVSGAVVLETQEQYGQAGLEPVKAGTVPTIPEPETVLLVAIVALLLLWALWSRRRSQLCRNGAA